jgi:hypothetical protein
MARKAATGGCCCMMADDLTELLSDSVRHQIIVATAIKYVV